MNASVVIGVLLVIASPNLAHAACTSLGMYSTCYDSDTGNSYSVQRYGGTTYLQGQNLNTGSSWRQQSSTYGGITRHSGTDADGNYWSGTEMNYGGVTTRSGFDSDGNYYSQTCTQWGCN